jgi:Kef-type K+ transport system membrane component KefB
LRTNIGLLDSGITWGYTIAIIIVVLVSKVTGSTLAARWSGMVWRESFTIGVLMSCKGYASLVVYLTTRLVELIVLNVGLQAGILSQRVFTMFVVMALITTFLTTPIVSFLYLLS